MQMIIRIDDATKEKVAQLAKAEGKNVSSLVRELLDDYIQSHDMGNYIAQIWNEIEHKLQFPHPPPKSLKHLIKKVRDQYEKGSD